MEAIINWLLGHIGVVVFIVVAVSAVRNMIRTARSGQNPGAPRRLQPEEEPEAAERTRQVQEEIRRKIEERRATVEERYATTDEPAAEGRSLSERLPPLVRPATVPPLDPFGGPMRKIVRKMEEAAEAQRAPRWEMDEGEEQAALARQQQLAEELRALEAARDAEQRRAAEILARETASRPAMKPALVIGSRTSLRAQLRDPQEARRAMVLREILGAPVGLR